MWPLSAECSTELPRKGRGRKEGGGMREEEGGRRQEAGGRRKVVGQKVKEESRLKANFIRSSLDHLRKCP